ncbi:MAG: hypothetical protein ACLU7D_11230 [Collinsella sp.]
MLIAVDEVDASFAQMTELVTTYQHFVSENKKVALLMAGLPFRVLALLTGKSTSFLRRAAQHSLGSISPTEVKEAFRLTIEDGGKTISDEAIDLAAKAIDGFPFMFQLVGYRGAGVLRARSHRGFYWGCLVQARNLRKRSWNREFSLQQRRNFHEGTLNFFVQ